MDRLMVALAAEEAGAGPLDKLGINLGFMIAQLFNFGVIFILGTIFMWRPLMNLLDARSAKIQKGLEDAAAAAYFGGRCSAYTSDASGLASIRSRQSTKPTDHIILSELISKEPLGHAGAPGGR